MLVSKQVYYMCMYVYACRNIAICMTVYKLICMHEYMHVCMYACMYCMRIYVCACIYVYTVYAIRLRVEKTSMKLNFQKLMVILGSHGNLSAL